MRSEARPRVRDADRAVGQPRCGIVAMARAPRGARCAAAPEDAARDEQTMVLWGRGVVTTAESLGARGSRKRLARGKLRDVRRFPAAKETPK